MTWGIRNTPFFSTICESAAAILAGHRIADHISTAQFFVIRRMNPENLRRRGMAFDVVHRFFGYPEQRLRAIVGGRARPHHQMALQVVFPMYAHTRFA
jgi:hypothetical protein